MMHDQSEEYQELFAYARWSSDQQTTSEEQQDDVIQNALTTLIPRLFKDKLGKVVQVYDDGGKSASKRSVRRDQFEQMLQDVKANKHKGRALIVVNLSRFTRLDLIDSSEPFRILRDHKIPLISVDDHAIINLRDDGAIHALVAKLNANKAYARSIAVNTARGRRRSVKHGQCATSIIPYGLAKLVIDPDGKRTIHPRTTVYNKHDKNRKSYLVPGDETEMSVVRWVFETLDKRDVSYRWMADQLNKHADPKVRQGLTGNGWRDRAIPEIITNLHYDGKEFIGMDPKGEHYRTTKGDVIPAYDFEEPDPFITNNPHNPGIIDHDLFQRVNAIVEARRLRNAKPKCHGDREGHCLTGMLVCGHCGGIMHPKPSGKTNVLYTCRTAQRNTSKGCDWWSVHEHRLLPFLLSRLNRAVRDALLEEPVDPGEETAGVQERLDELTDRIDALREQVRELPVAVARELVPVISELVQERDRLQQQVNANDRTAQLAVARMHWENTITPFLQPVRVDEGVDDDVADALSLTDDEFDALVNYVNVRPSEVRAALKGVGCRVELYFKRKTTRGKGCTGKRQRYELDHGRCEAVLSGHRQSIVSDSGCSHGYRRRTERRRRGARRSTRPARRPPRP